MAAVSNYFLYSNSLLSTSYIFFSIIIIIILPAAAILLLILIKHDFTHHLLLISLYKTHKNGRRAHTCQHRKPLLHLGLVYIPIQLLKTQMASTTGIDGTLASDEDEGQTIGSSQFGEQTSAVATLSIGFCILEQCWNSKWWCHIRLPHWSTKLYELLTCEGKGSFGAVYKALRSDRPL